MPIVVRTDDSEVPSDYPVLSVDLKALSDVAVALRQEVDGNLVTHITQLNCAYAGVESVLEPAPPPDPRTAFDPGPNVIGIRR